MNITKTIAAEVAEKLLSKQALEIKNLRNKLESTFDEIYLKTIPKEVVELFKKYPNYFKTRNNFHLSGNGFDWKSITAYKSLPYINYAFQPNEKDSIILHNSINKIDKKKSEYKKLHSEIEIALFGLRTYKRVEENFPEAFLLLPNKITTSLAVNISDLRNKIK